MLTWQPGPRNSKPEPVEFYRTADESLWESGEIKNAAIELACLAVAFVVIAIAWWWL